MTTVVRRFQDGDAKAIERLNQRLASARSVHRVYPEDLSGNPDADLAVRPINDALFVASDGEEIRGGGWLREQYFWVDGEKVRVGWMKYPVSESLIDSRFAGVPASMVLQFLRRQPVLMALGMGGHDAPFARLLAGIGWQFSTIPLWFRIARPHRVLRGLTYARRRFWRRVGMDVAAWTGLGWLLHRAFHATAHRIDDAGLSATVESSFTPWADDVWERCRSEYAVLAVRDSRTLDHLYHPSFPGLDRLRITRGDSDIGWACAQVLGTDKGNTSYFGELKVGVVTDVLARPADATAVLDMAVRHLEAQGVDLTISYLCHSTWKSAAKRLRFLAGPSTFAFYRSPKADEALVSGTLDTRCHLTRSDGDGPTH